MGSPMRQPAVKRQGEIGDKGEDSKTRRVETEPDLSMTPDKSEDMKLMAVDDRIIIASIIMGVDITEVFSPERVVTVARRMGLTPGSSMDLTTGWDFSK